MVTTLLDKVLVLQSSFNTQANKQCYFDSVSRNQKTEKLT